MGMHRGFTIIIVLLVSALSFSLASSAGEDNLITEAAAVNASIQYITQSDDFNVTGNLSATEVELDKDKGKHVYEVELEDEAGIEYDVLVDAGTGAIIQQEDRGADSSVKPEDDDDEVEDGDDDKAGKEDEDEDDGVKAKKPKKNMEFQSAGDEYTGKYVSFSFNETTGEITDFVLGNTTMFSTISINDFLPTKIKVDGSEIKFEMKVKSEDDDEDAIPNENGDSGNEDVDSDDDEDKVKLEIHDNPKGLIKLDVSGNRTVTFVLADGISGALSNGSITLSGELNSSLVQIGHEEGSVDFSITGDTVTADVTDAKLMFRTHPVTTYRTSEHAEHHKHVMDGIVDGDVGGEVDIEDEDSNSTVVYDSLNISIEQVENNTVSIDVSSELSQGTTVSLSVSSDILEVIQAENVTILFDGEQIQMADSYDDIMDSEDDGGVAEYLVVVGSEGVEVLVSIPHFSAHSITITTAPTGAAAEEEATGAPGFGFMTAAAGILLLYLAIRRD